MRPKLERAVPAAALALVGGALFFGGGLGDGSLLWLGGGCVLLLLVAPWPAPTRAGWAALGLLAAFVAWTGISILWSLQPDRSWAYLNRGLVYLAFLLVGMALAPRAREAGYGLAALLAAVAVWALAVKLFPGLSGQTLRVDRLQAPVGYWNGLALLGCFALPLGLWLLRERRLLGGALLGLWTVTIVLTYSRGGVLVAGLAVLAWLALVHPRLRRPALVAAAAGAVVLALVVGMHWHELTNPNAVYVQNNVGRLASASGNNRWSWWSEAWHGFTGRPLGGTGAGTFELTHERLRPNDNVTPEPHNVWLQFLSETGIVGFLLFAGFAAAALAGLARRARAPAEIALALILPLFLLHALIDFDWDFLALAAPAFLAAGLLLAGPPSNKVLLGFGRLAGAGVGLAVVASLLSPWLASRKLDQANAQLGVSPRAVPLARQAHRLDPLSVDPLFVEAEAEQLAGRLGQARSLYLQATRLQPDNKETWYELGAFELQLLNDPRLALPHLERFTELDPQGPGGDLYRQALAAVNSGAP